MATLGLNTALDLQLLGGAPAEAEELMSELSSGGLTLGHRAKIRLLMAPASATNLLETSPEQRSQDCGKTPAHDHRQLQSDSGLSVDTVRCARRVATMLHCSTVLDRWDHQISFAIGI
eukprot:SAG31_NODE_2651_length_5296_cov_2.101770_6_plen_118_part_00